MRRRALRWWLPVLVYNLLPPHVIHATQYGLATIEFGPDPVFTFAPRFADLRALPFGTMRHA